jgi:hypothetical protein
VSAPGCRARREPDRSKCVNSLRDARRRCQTSGSLIAMSIREQRLIVEPGAPNVIGESLGSQLLEPDRAAGTYGRRVVHAPDATVELRLAGAATLPVALADLFPRD